MSDLPTLWDAALAGDRVPLEQELIDQSHLPGPRANLELAGRFADVVGRSSADQRSRALAVLGDWLGAPPRFAAAVPEGAAEYLPACAALAAGALAERPLLTQAAADPRWRVRELAATGMQRMLSADWDVGMDAVRAWLTSADLLVVRAAVAAAAEPRLLREPDHAAQAFGVIDAATRTLLEIPAARRREDPVRVLRQALGYAVSVVTVASPDAGIALLKRLSAADDPDARWIAKENLRKARLKPFAARLGAFGM